jgi:chromosomal replication initiator protein
MALLDDRLRTRFEWGLMADVQQPVLETRVAIVKNKAANLGLILSNEVANYIANKITSNVRQLEGTVHKIKAFHDLGIEIDQSTVDRAIQDMIRSNEFIITPENIIKEVCRYFRVEEDQIRGPSRSREILNARQIAMYLIRSMTSLSLDETGKLFKRDHTTALNGITKIENRMKGDNNFAETVKAIITNINASK